jgi:hypothetical protein
VAGRRRQYNVEKYGSNASPEEETALSELSVPLEWQPPVSPRDSGDYIAAGTQLANVDVDRDAILTGLTLAWFVSQLPAEQSPPSAEHEI